MDPVSSKITEKLLTSLGTKALNLIFRRVKATKTKEPFDDKGIERLLTEVKNWCTRIQFFGVSKALGTARQSIALGFHETPRRFRGKANLKERASEMELLREPSHHLVLGDPGSGKTTTLKRLAYHLLTKESKGKEIQYSFPIVVLCRDLSKGETMLEHIAFKFGISVQKRKKGKKDRLMVGDVELDQFLADTLNDLFPLILIDGLDEAPVESIGLLFQEVRRFAKRLAGPKMIVTCRSALYEKDIEGFDILEVLPLDFKQIDLISRI